MTPAQSHRSRRALRDIQRWPCLLSSPIRIMGDTRWPRPLLYDRAPAIAPATGIEGEAVMLIAPCRHGGSSTAVVGDRDTIREMAHTGGRRALEVATIDGRGCLVPATRARKG